MSEIKLKPSEKENYVNNNQLYDAYAVWYDEVEKGNTTFQDIPPFIVDSMIKIATRTTYNHKFVNYSYRDDFISDGLYDCIRFAKNFKLTYLSKKTGVVEKGNAFSYLTTICINAFYRRIDKEHKETYVKSKIVTDNIFGDFLDQINTDDADYKNQYIEFLREVGSSGSCIPMALKRIDKKKNAVSVKGPLDEFS